HVVGAEGVDLPLDRPFTAAPGHAAAGDVVGIAPCGSPPGVDEQDIARAHVHALLLRGRGEFVALDEIPRRQPVAPGGDEVDEDDAADDRRQGLRGQRGEAAWPLVRGRHGDAAEHHHVLGLVAERVDVRARVVGREDHPGGARSALQALLVPPVQHERVVRVVRGEHRHPLEARLLQVDDPGAGQQRHEPGLRPGGIRGHRAPSAAPMAAISSSATLSAATARATPAYTATCLSSAPICSGVQPLRSAPAVCSLTSPTWPSAATRAMVTRLRTCGSSPSSSHDSPHTQLVTNCWNGAFSGVVLAMTRSMYSSPSTARRTAMACSKLSLICRCPPRDEVRYTAVYIAGRRGVKERGTDPGRASPARPTEGFPQWICS